MPSGRLVDQRVVVAQARQPLGQLGQLVVVRGEQRPAADAVVQVLRDGPGQRHAVVGAGAAADLVEDHQAARRGVVQDVGRLGHLHHERALRPAQLVAGADAREDAVGQADASPVWPARSCPSGPAASAAPPGGCRRSYGLQTHCRQMPGRPVLTGRKLASPVAVLTIRS